MESGPIKEVTANVVGKKCAKFKAGAELSGRVNAVYFDTNFGSTDGESYEYSVQFIIEREIIEPTI
jgi:hypothetical protein